nr:GFA family protein [Rhizobium sp. Q54]
MTVQVYTGGCQCGATRFRITGPVKGSSICHCRMCQKAFGAFFAPLVDIGDAEPVWTRGGPKHFQSSNHVKRGFCPECGTPLTYEAADGMAVATGAFDEPSQLAPTVQYGVEGRLPFMDSLHRLPERHTMDDIEAAPFLADIVSRQHPDHDTETWPEGGTS